MPDRPSRVLVVSDLEVHTERLPAFLDWMRDGLDASRAADGNLRFDVLVDQHSDGRVTLVEEWESPSHQAAYMAWRAGRGDFEAMAPFLRARPRMTVWHEA